jgi:anti-anti-sigma factor
MLASRSDPDFSLTVAPGADGSTVITVLGELDAQSGGELRAAFTRAWEEGGPIVLDLRGCTFMDSRGIASIVGVAWQLKGTPRRLTLRGVGPRMRQILELTGVVDHEAVAIETFPS